MLELHCFHRSLHRSISDFYLQSVVGECDVSRQRRFVLAMGDVVAHMSEEHFLGGGFFGDFEGLFEVKMGRVRFGAEDAEDKRIQILQLIYNRIGHVAQVSAISQGTEAVAD